MNELTTEKTMTTKEVAEALGVSTDTIKNCIRRIMPNRMTNGKTTYLNEFEVAIISKELKNNDKVIEQLTYEAGSQVKNTTTDLEILNNAMVALADLKIVGKDWWLKRSEYDGSEWWDYMTLPIKPSEQKAVLRVITSGIGDETLAEMQTR